MPSLAKTSLRPLLCSEAQSSPSQPSEIAAVKLPALILAIWSSVSFRVEASTPFSPRWPSLTTVFVRSSILARAMVWADGGLYQSGCLRSGAMLGACWARAGRAVGRAVTVRSRAAMAQ